MAKYRTLKDLKEEIEALIKENPQYADLPIIYASDDEGNDYQKVHNTLTLMIVEDIDGRSLEVNNEEEDGDSKKINCICIN
jgi:hypothetical protein